MLQRFCISMAVLLMLPYYTIIAKNNLPMVNTDSVKCVGGLIGVKPEYKERYIILHKYTFPGVLDRIRKSNIRNYSIFLLDDILFSHYEYIGSDFEKDMKDIADPVTRDWWKLTDPMQEPLSFRKEGEWWAGMDLLFYLSKKIKPSAGATRIGLTADIVEGKDDAVIALCKNFPEELKAITNKYSFQNCNLYYTPGKLYYYYEYVGDDITKSFTELRGSDEFQKFQTELNKYLAVKDGNYWQPMNEVFHTD